MRIAVVSDVHSNLVALDAVLAHAGPSTRLAPRRHRRLRARSRTASWLACGRSEHVGVRGNHDAAAVGGDEIEHFNPDARAAMDWTRDAIAAETRAWLAGLPERRTEGDVTLVHGSPRDPTWEYLTTTPMRARLVRRLTTTHGLNGHTHVPVAFVMDDDRVDRAPAA